MGNGNIDGNFIDELYEMCTDGLVIAFPKTKSDEINLYILKDICTQDDLENGIVDVSKLSCDNKLKYDLSDNMWKLQKSF
ncbi:hypothetical protein [Acetivibrio straminisolvens]|jgi:hypothetical protein|uniref:Uncharacterized protein n=1 Tax=Acetivibrio straminisolvens JCM 21531 TaxID=1294263 RepID=W4V8Q2_9FIRM|nr:hypothetical protein [Acetivibrio straminisolvens]GAE89770.1 hypothetical protein JCM21531_3328 [Acetivibrio straminisolvens JCM 21531]